MNESVTDLLLRHAARSTGYRADMLNHAATLAREAEAKALEASNTHNTQVRVAYPPLVLLVAKAADQGNQLGGDE